MRRLSATLCAGALLGASATAHAQGIDEFGAYGSRRGVETPQSFAFELRIGRYVPSIDEEFDNGATPYETTFGTDNRYSFGIEVDWQAMRIPFFGTLGPGIGFEYTKLSAPGFLTSTFPQRAAGEETALVILPMYAVAVLRMDFLARETAIPLVPYAKLGLGGAIWLISNGGGTANVDGLTGSGFSYGPQGALGGMFLLDSIDGTAAKAMDSNTGVNNSYFFLEWYVSKLGITGDQMHVGTSTWVLGLALEI